jgi:hypothetical protein
MRIGPSIARLCGIIPCTRHLLRFPFPQNTAAVSSDEEDDITQLQTVEHKLLTHDPAFGVEQTHAALSSQRSAFLSAFRPQYVDGNVEGMLACPR